MQENERNAEEEGEETEASLSLFCMNTQVRTLTLHCAKGKVEHPM